MRCPKCNRIILDKNTNGTHRLRTRVVLFEPTGTIAVCPQCKERITVPITLTDSVKTSVKHFILTSKNS